MHFNIHQVILVLTATLLAFSEAGCSDFSKCNTNTSPWIGRRGLSNLVKRDGRHKCGSTQGVATNADTSVMGGSPDGPDKFKPRAILPKRALSPLPANEASETLSFRKRTLDPFPSDIPAQDQVMIRAVSSATQDIVAANVNGNDINSGVYREIGGTDPTEGFSLGLGNTTNARGDFIRLKGCTTLIVMSQRAVWFGHFWEDLSYAGGDSLFRKTVLDLLYNGGTDNPDMQQPLMAHADNFRGQASASAWIIQPVPGDVIPDDGTTLFQDHDDQNTLLQNTVFEMTGITAHIHAYR